MGANAVVGRGIKKVSFVTSLNKSSAIWKAPFRPIKTGPIRRIANAKSLRSVNTTNKVYNTVKSAIIRWPSLNLKNLLNVSGVVIKSGQK